MNDSTGIQCESKMPESEDISDSNIFAAPPSPENSSCGSEMSGNRSLPSSQTESKPHLDHDVEPKLEDDQQETMTVKISMCRAVVVYQGGMSKVVSSSGSDESDCELEQMGDVSGTRCMFNSTRDVFERG